jgi:benzoate/toluate 1,2-dioxygenase alpha subunit
MAITDDALRAPALGGADPDELILDAPHTYRVHTRAYTDPAVFEAEMRRVFARTWVYVGHASEIPGPGDYKTAHIGLQPVILSRDDDGEIHVLVNRCVHRGSVVCRDARGTANYFRCPYHGWVYGKDGSLTGISMRQGESGYSEHFQAPAGLHRVPRVASYRGLIFASFNPDVPSIEEHLGKAAFMIDNKLDQSPSGELVLRSDPYVVRYKGNWKFQAENIIDGYHFTFVHEGFIKLQEKYGDTTGDFGVHRGSSMAEVRKVRAKGVSWGSPHGHGLSAKPLDDVEPLLCGEFGEYYRGLLDAHGAERLAWIAGSGAMSIFPNLGMIHHQIRVWRPLAPGLTEVTVYPYELAGAPDEINRGWLRSQERFYGPAGHGMPDDVEIFALNQQGLDASAVDWLILERGLDNERPTEDGNLEGLPSGETSQRAFWRRWRRLMAEGG